MEIKCDKTSMRYSIVSPIASFAPFSVDLYQHTEPMNLFPKELQSMQGATGRSKPHPLITKLADSYQAFLVENDYRRKGQPERVSQQPTTTTGLQTDAPLIVSMPGAFPEDVPDLLQDSSEDGSEFVSTDSSLEQEYQQIVQEIEQSGLVRQISPVEQIPMVVGRTTPAMVHRGTMIDPDRLVPGRPFQNKPTTKN